MTPTPQEVRELAAAALADPDTVRRAYRAPDRVRSSSIERITRAARRLGIEPPPGPVRHIAPPDRGGPPEAA